MKQLIKKYKGVVKGGPSAVLISAMVHIILLFVAGGLVVFTMKKNEGKKFVPPPPVERPKMDLIQPRVKVKKTVKPGSTQRIVSKTVQNMPDLQLPALSGMGGGLGTGIGGFELTPNLAGMSLFGGEKSIAAGNDFEGTFYSFSYDRQGKETNIGSDGSIQLLRTFNELDWNPRAFARYYRSSKKLYASFFIIPTFYSEYGPECFGIDDPEFNTAEWMVHYKGKIASRTGGRFRFWGAGDAMLLVRIGKEIVLDASWDGWKGQVSGWESTSKDEWKYFMGHTSAGIGDWFELEPDVPVEMQVILQENGGLGCFMLAIQQEGVDYPKNRDGMPVLPVFKTAEIPESVRAKIEYGLIKGEVELQAGPIFNVY